MSRRTCLECARFVYQEAEEGDRLSPDTHVVMWCARDQWRLETKYADVERLKAALFTAETCGMFYDGKALGVE